MDQPLLRSYFATLYELPTPNGVVRVSLDGDSNQDKTQYPPVLLTTFALLTAYNPRSMLLPRRVNEQRHVVMRDLLILGCYRVEPCIGYEADKQDSVWREPAWLVHGMPRDEATAFGRVFRQNTVICAVGGRPDVIVTDPTADDIGTSFQGQWRVRS
ncbi:MAG: DUF3293 domain-containing protein [Myxococcales bacterium]|nr:DUF3293 domain-containing protein [Myxococcales bacterium]